MEHDERPAPLKTPDGSLRIKSTYSVTVGVSSSHLAKMLHLPELAEVGTLGFARGTEGGAATFSARPIDSDPSLVGRLHKPQLGSNLNLKPKDCRVGSKVDLGRDTRTTQIDSD
jgi:hypothetical protein